MKMKTMNISSSNNQDDNNNRNLLIEYDCDDDKLTKDNNEEMTTIIILNNITTSTTFLIDYNDWRFIILKDLIDFRTKFVQTIIEPCILKLVEPFFHNHPIFSGGSHHYPLPPEDPLESSSLITTRKIATYHHHSNHKNNVNDNDDQPKGQYQSQRKRIQQKNQPLGAIGLHREEENDHNDDNMITNHNRYNQPLHPIQLQNNNNNLFPFLYNHHDANGVTLTNNISRSQKDIFYNNHYHRRLRQLGFLPSYVSTTTAFNNITSSETSMSFSALSMLFITLSFIFLIFLSCFYHNQKTSPLFISPRRHRLPKLVPPPLPIDHYFSWIRICFYLSDEEILNRIGYDSLIFIRFHRLALRCIVKMSVFSFIVLLPLNYTGGGGHAKAQDLKEYVDSLFFTDFLRFTMANIKAGSPRLWVHCFAAYLLTVIVIRELLIEYEHFNAIRHRYLLSREPHLRTVLVTNIPRHLRSASKITNYFKHVYPNAVKSVFICQNLIQLEKLVSSRTNILHRIEKELLLLYRSEKKKLIYYEQSQQLQQNQKLISTGYLWNKAVSITDRVEDYYRSYIDNIRRNNNDNNNTNDNDNRCCATCCSILCICFGGVDYCSDNNNDNNFILSYCCCYHGTQERLTKQYVKLEELNNDIECEQRRRRRVMKMLDRMDAGEGAKEIDYVLASPFVIDSNNPSHRAVLGLSSYKANRKQQHQQQLMEQQQPVHDENDYEPPRIVNPSITDNIELPLSIPEGNENQIETTIHDNDNSNGINMDYRLDEDGLNQLRSRSPPASSSSNNNSSNNNSKDQHIDGIMTIDHDDHSMNEQDRNYSKSNKKNRKVSFAKARSAIQRYGRQPEMNNILAQPIMQPQHHQSSWSSYLCCSSDNTKDGTNSNNNNVGKSSISSSAKIEDHINEVTDKAFVVMRTFTAATIAIQSMHSSKPGSMQVSTAPEPRDILWENIYMSKGAFRTRCYLGEFVVLLIITFYIVPVATIALFVSEQALISSSPKLAQLAQASAFFSAAIALVQPLCVVGLQQLLPPLFIAIGRMEGITSFSEVQMKTFSRYFLFQVVNVFLVTTIAGSIFDTVAIILENPEKAFEMLGNSLPRMSSFFIAFVTVKTFLGLGFELVRTMALVQATARYIVFPNATLRAKRLPLASMRAIDDPGWFPFHKVLAQDMLVVVISVVFAVVAPLVTLPCALFCLCSRIMWTHHHLYVYESVFESGGQFWPKIFRRFVFGLIISQMTITGQFILKEARHQAYATILLMFLTYFFLRSTRARYDPTSSTLPLEVATVMDISLKQDEDSNNDPNYHPESMMSSARGDAAAVGNGSNRGMSPREQDPCGGTYIGLHDPFRKAYIQPALRANPRARPEQPFPAAQLGRNHPSSHHNHHHDGSGGGNNINMFNSDASVSTDSGVGAVGSAGWGHDGRATVRLKSMNQNDRRLINRWWNDQLQRAGPQNNFSVLIGEECGTLTLSGDNNNNGMLDPDMQQQYEQNHSTLDDKSFV